MAYTKDYYHVLGLEAPSWTESTRNTSSSSSSSADMRKAYKLALLAAHPDKHAAQKKGAYTVDDVKEAYTVLANDKSKREYDTWFLHHGHTLRQPGSNSSSGDGKKVQEDFVLGLEVLDLGDFDVVDASSPGSSSSVNGEEEMYWIRACRCGAENGFRIEERELEGAERRGEKEVLVGCDGCSLWVRVGFEVEVG
jgi:diphthamide biosynthesis protein 4